MRHTALIILLLALCLPFSVLAQPGDRAPRRGADGDAPAPERREDRDDRDGRDREHHRPPDTEPLPIELVPEALETVRELHPDSRFLPRITQMVKDNPERAAESLARFPRIRELIDIRKNWPEEFKLHIEQAGLIREFFSHARKIHMAKRDNNQDELDELRPVVRDVVERLFDVRLAIEQQKIERMRADLEKAEDALRRLREDREQEISDRTKDVFDRDPPTHRRGGGDGDRRRRDRGDEREDERDEGRDSDQETDRPAEGAGR